MIRTLQARLANLSNTSVTLPLYFSSPKPRCYFFRYRLHHCPIASAETMDVLSTKKCVPCNIKDLRPMTEEAANQLTPQVSGWDLVNDGGTLKLHRSWKVKTFMKGLEFFQEVASIAEAEGHHPDLHLVGWNNVKIDIWTHSVGGLTENDFILAAKVNGLDVQHLLSKNLADQHKAAVNLQV